MRRTVDSFIPFMLDRIAASTRLLNAHSIQFIGMIITAYLSEYCRQKPEPTPPQTEQEQPAREEQSTSAETISTQETLPERPNEDEARSVDAVSIDSSDLSNRFANMDQGGEEEEIIGEGNNDGDRTPQNLPEERPTQEQEMELEHQPAVTQEQPDEETGDTQPTGEQSQSTESVENTENTEDPEDAEDQPGPSGLHQPEEGDDGIDPAFLAALPEDIRQEGEIYLKTPLKHSILVIRDHQRQQRLNRLQRQRQQSTSIAENPAARINQEAADVPAAENQQQAEDEVLDQEFLNALPPEIQEEVLAQHEQRLAARNAATNQNAEGNEPAADAIAFLDSLNPTLRAQVLADADDSVIQVIFMHLSEEVSCLSDTARQRGRRSQPNSARL